MRVKGKNALKILKKTCRRTTCVFKNNELQVEGLGILQRKETEPRQKQEEKNECLT